MRNTQGILLTGLDGSNPLAFLTALGTLRTVWKQFALVELGWVLNDGKWTPELCNIDVAVDEFPTTLAGLLPKNLEKPWNIDKKLPFAASRLRELALEVAGKPFRDDEAIAVIPALGCEVFEDDKGQFEDTAFRMVRSGDSAGQGFLDYACKIAINATHEDLAQCLFHRWVYADRGSSLRWDPTENREYALQAGNPSADGALSVIGANRLALEALSLFPTHPNLNGVVTTGFYRPGRRSDPEFRWPIWDIPLSLAVIGSLLVHPNLFCDPIKTHSMLAMGVRAVFSARQIRPNQYYRNFSPAQPLF